jgi:hypothetical protein
VNTSSIRPWRRQAVAVLAALTVLTPVFAWAASAVGYTEPLEHAAVATGATDAATTTVPPLVSGYAIGGLGPTVGTLAAAALGTGLTLAVTVAAGRALER